MDNTQITAADGTRREPGRSSHPTPRRRLGCAVVAVAVAAIAVLAWRCGSKAADERQSTAPTATVVTPADTTALVVQMVRRCSRLHTTEWHLHKIVTHDDDLRLRGQLLGQSFDVSLPAGQRKIAIPMDATVKGYVDLGGFSADNVRRQGDRITVYLPNPEAVLTSSKVDWQGTKSYVALTRSRFTDEEMADYTRQGRQAMMNAIPTLGIEQAAQESAARLLVPMLTQMGFSEQNITITFRDDMRLVVKEDTEH